MTTGIRHEATLPAGSPPPRQRALSLLLFSLASNAAVLFTLWYGLYLWPERLPVNSQNLFWLASGINLGGLLLLGTRYWPLLLLNAFPPWLLLSEPLDFCLLGAIANTLEALLGVWIVRKAGNFQGHFDTLRSIGALVIASLVAPLANTLLIPAYLCASGLYPWSEYFRALGNWNLANGTATLLLSPLVVTLLGRNWAPSHRQREHFLSLLATGMLAFLAFAGLFSGKGMNLAFLAFPAILYTAVRFGVGETTLALGVTLLGIYTALFTHGQHHPVSEMPAILWFAQAITWVLAATGLLVAALGAERRLAERRSLQASLAAEQARLAALRYQINPHFLFNALNSIRSTLPLPETVARDMLTSLSGYLRSTLDSGESATAPLAHELDHLRAYLTIEQHRFGPDLIICEQIAPDTTALPVPTLLLQPLVENAIRHGLEKNPGPCHITLSAHRTTSHLHLAVINTGRWDTSERPNSTGLRNVRHRLHLLYGPAATLEIRTPGNTVEIHLTLPL